MNCYFVYILSNTLLIKFIAHKVQQKNGHIMKKSDLFKFIVGTSTLVLVFCIMELIFNSTRPLFFNIIAIVFSVITGSFLGAVTIGHFRLKPFFIKALPLFLFIFLYFTLIVNFELPPSLDIMMNIKLLPFIFGYVYGTQTPLKVRT